MLADLLPDLPADPLHRVQRGHRVLEDHRDLAPRTSRISSWEREQVAALVEHPPEKVTFRSRLRPMTDMGVTVLPEPDSPTTPSTSPARDRERDPVDGADEALLGAERHLEIVDVEQLLLRDDQASLTRGSSQA